MTLKNFVFLLVDFDNSQVETEEHVLPSLIARFNQFWGAEVGQPMTLELFREKFHGLAREKLCEAVDKYYTEQLGNAFTVDYKLWYERREERVLAGYQAVPGGIEMAPGLLETLTSLKNQLAGMALVTNSPMRRVLGAMLCVSNRQGPELAQLFGANMFEAGDQQKPLPDVYLRAMQQLGTDAQHCYAVEDSASGVKSAVAAGIPCFGFTGFAHGTETKAKLADGLRKAGTLAIFDSWTEFNALFKQTLVKKAA